MFPQCDGCARREERAQPTPLKMAPPSFGSWNSQSKCHTESRKE
jgi:hypothetical protein